MRAGLGCSPDGVGQALYGGQIGSKAIGASVTARRGTRKDTGRARSGGYCVSKYQAKATAFRGDASGDASRAPSYPCAKKALAVINLLHER